VGKEGVNGRNIMRELIGYNLIIFFHYDQPPIIEGGIS
jgi:hypothetical protein